MDVIQSPSEIPSLKPASLYRMIMLIEIKYLLFAILLYTVSLFNVFRFHKTVSIIKKKLLYI